MPISLESTGSSTASSAASAVPSRESSPDPSALQLASTSGSSTTSSSPAHPLYASTDEPSALIPARLTGLDLQRLKDQQQQFVAAAVQESQPVPSLSLMDANRTGDSAETDVSSNISRGETTGLATFRPSSPPPPSLSATKTTFLTATTITAAPTVATQLEPNSGQECNGGGSSAAPVLRPRTRSASTLSLQQFPPSTTSVPVLELDPGHQDLKKRAISPMLSEADRSGEDSCPPCLSTPFPSGNTRSRSRSRTSSSAVLATEITSSKTSLTDITQTASGRDDRGKEYDLTASATLSSHVSGLGLYDRHGLSVATTTITTTSPSTRQSKRKRVTIGSSDDSDPMEECLPPTPQGVRASHRLPSPQHDDDKGLLRMKTDEDILNQQQQRRRRYKSTFTKADNGIEEERNATATALDGVAPESQGMVTRFRGTRRPPVGLLKVSSRSHHRSSFPASRSSLYPSPHANGASRLSFSATSSLRPPSSSFTVSANSSSSSALSSSTAPSSTLPFTPSARALSLASIDMTWDDPTQKPPFSYASLIARAILESRELKLTLGDIYAWITSRYPWYKHSPPAWQNSIRHNLSLNKAFRKLERTVGEPGKGCFWSLEPAGDVQPKESSSSSAMGYVARKRTSKRDAGSLGRVSSQSDVGAQQQEDSDIDDDDDVNDDSHRHHKDSPGPQNILSPAASDEADNEKIMLATSTQPRRSGRARKPPKPRDMDDFILASSTSALSLHRTNSSSALTLPSSSTLSTPPCSPGGPLEGKKSTATVLTCASSFDSTGRGASAATAGDASGGDSDLIMTSRRVRRPPPKLSEFVSSEDFKASVVGITARSGRRTDRAASGQSSTRTSLSPAPSTPLPSLTTSAPDNRSPVPTDHPTLSVNSKESKKDRRPKIEILIPSRQKANFTPSLTRAAGHLTPCLGAELPIIGSEAPSFGTAVTPLGSSGSSAAIPLRRIGPPSVSLSALSHKKRPSLDQTLYGGMCNDAKKSRRLSMQERRRSSTTTAIMDSNSGRMMEDDDGAAVATACKRRRERKEEHQRLLQRIRREALKHEDDDWSGSDFEFLREEEEKYLRRICAGTRRGARPQQYRWRNDDVSDDEVDGEEDEEEDWDADSLVEFGEGRRIGKQSRFGAGEAEAERKAKALLLDPSVIAYGFDSGDQDYILDYHQSPLFNSVSWPEFSDVKTGLNVSSTNASTGGVPTVVAVAPAAAAAAAATATTEALNHMDTTGNSTQASHTTVSATSQASLMHQPILVPPVTSTLSISPPSVPLTPPSSLLPLKEEQQ